MGHIIELSQIELEKITHIRICNINWEVERSVEKQGHMTVWLARCYIENDQYIEDNRYSGVKITIVNSEYDDLKDTITEATTLQNDFEKIISQWLINNHYVEGIVREI